MSTASRPYAFLLADGKPSRQLAETILLELGFSQHYILPLDYELLEPGAQMGSLEGVGIMIVAGNAMLTLYEDAIARIRSHAPRLPMVALRTHRVAENRQAEEEHILSQYKLCAVDAPIGMDQHHAPQEAKIAADTIRAFHAARMSASLEPYAVPQGTAWIIKAAGTNGEALNQGLLGVRFYQNQICEIKGYSSAWKQLLSVDDDRQLPRLLVIAAPQGNSATAADFIQRVKTALTHKFLLDPCIPVIVVAKEWGDTKLDHALATNTVHTLLREDANLVAALSEAANRIIQQRDQFPGKGQSRSFLNTWVPGPSSWSSTGMISNP